MSDEGAKVDNEHAEYPKGLGQFVAPGLEDLRPELLSIWKEGFSDVKLADQIASNPRLTPRIAANICELVGQPAQLDTIPDVYHPMICAIMTIGETKLADYAGCLWHRSTVLDWITWNSFELNLPNLDFNTVRRCFRMVPAELGVESGAPRKSSPKLSQAALQQSGRNCIHAWLLQASPEIRERFTLFLAPSQHTESKRGAELMTPLAECLLAGAP
jgi:hypothetical protein